MRVYLELEVRRVACRRCQAVKREQLDFLADNPFYTERFAFYVGRRCRVSTIKDVAEELHPIARYSVWAHLRKLADDGRVTSSDVDDLGASWAPRLPA